MNLFMRRYSSAVVVVLCACSSTRDTPPVKVDTPAPKVAAVAPVAVPDSDADGCMADTSHAHPTPRALLDEFLERDGRGDFMRTDPWNATAVECPGHTPGWDESTVVTNWKVTALLEHPDTARYVVVFTRFGRATQDSVGLYLVPEPSAETDTVTMVHMPYGWRIDSYQYNPHVLPAGLRGQRSWRAKDAHLLDSLINSGSRSLRPGA
jgi:hypothetical protein